MLAIVLSDGLSFIPFVCATAVIARCSYLSALQLIPTDTMWDRVLCALLLGWANIVVSTHLAGVLSCVYAAHLQAIAVTMALAVMLCLRLWNARLDSVVVGDRAIPRTTCSWSGLWAIYGVFCLSAVLVHAVMYLPREWDDLMYHMPMIDHWIRDGSLVGRGNPSWYNPSSCECLGLWLSIPFSGDYFARCLNLPVLCLFVLAAYKLARQLRCGLLQAHLFAFSVGLSPVCLRQLPTCHNDLGVVALFSAALSLALRFRYSRSPSLAFMLGVSIGLLAGIKYYAIGYAIIPTILAGTLLLRRSAPRSFIECGTIVVVVTSAVCGYWYIRNYMASGTPLYPLGITSATDALERIRPGTWKSTLLLNGKVGPFVEYVLSLWRVGGALSCGVVIAAVPAIAGMLVGEGIRKRTACARVRSRNRCILFIAVSSMIVFGMTPYAVSPDNPSTVNGDYTIVRYSLCMVLASALVVLIVFARVGVHWPGGHGRGMLAHRRMCVSVGQVVCVGGLSLYAALAGVRYYYDVVLPVCGSLIACGYVARMTAVYSHHIMLAWRPVSVSLGAILLIVGVCVTSYHWHSRYPEVYSALYGSELLRESQRLNVSGRICVMDYCYYPFFGSRRQYDVCRPEMIASPEELHNYVRRNRIDVLCVVRHDPYRYGRYRHVCGWAADRPDLYVKVASDFSRDIFEVRAK